MSQHEKPSIIDPRRRFMCEAGPVAPEMHPEHRSWDLACCHTVGGLHDRDDGRTSWVEVWSPDAAAPTPVAAGTEPPRPRLPVALAYIVAAAVRYRAIAVTIDVDPASIRTSDALADRDDVINWATGGIEVLVPHFAVILRDFGATDRFIQHLEGHREWFWWRPPLEWLLRVWLEFDVSDDLVEARADQTAVRDLRWILDIEADDL